MDMTGDPVSSGEGRLTRRAVLGGMAAAGAASLVAPAAGLASGLEAHPVFSRWVGSLARESAPLSAPRRFALVGVEWVGAAGARIELRTRTRDGSWSRWALASVLGHEPDRGPTVTGGGSDRAVFGEPIWTGPAD